MKIKEHGAQRTRITNNKCKTGRLSMPSQGRSPGY